MDVTEKTAEMMPEMMQVPLDQDPCVDFEEVKKNTLRKEIQQAL